jgi:hypothetical protein
VRGVDGDRAAAADQGLPALVIAAAAGSVAAEAAAAATPLVAHSHNLTSDVLHLLRLCGRCFKFE